MKQPEIEELRELLRRKELAASQDTSQLQLGAEIHLSLTALEEARLKRLLALVLKQSPMTLLAEQSKAAFFVEIEKRRVELLALPEEYAITQIHDELGGVLDSLLDEREDGFTKMLMSICQERPDLFTVQPDSIASLIDEPWGKITAQTIVYINVYSLLRSILEFEFCLWHQEHHRDE